MQMNMLKNDFIMYTLYQMELIYRLALAFEGAEMIRLDRAFVFQKCPCPI